MWLEKVLVKTVLLRTTVLASLLVAQVETIKPSRLGLQLRITMQIIAAVYRPHNTKHLPCD